MVDLSTHVFRLVPMFSGSVPSLDDHVLVVESKYQPPPTKKSKGVHVQPAGASIVSLFFLCILAAIVSDWLRIVLIYSINSSLNFLSLVFLVGSLVFFSVLCGSFVAYFFAQRKSDGCLMVLVSLFAGMAAAMLTVMSYYNLGAAVISAIIGTCCLALISAIASRWHNQHNQDRIDDDEGY